MRSFLNAMKVVFILALPAVASAQYWRFSAFVAPTAWSEPFYPPTLFQSPTTFSLEFGAGLERLIFRGIGIGADLQGVSPGAQRTSDSAGFACFNGFCHFRRNHALDPFVTAGYALSMPYSNENTVDWGGGINYWMSRRYGALLEFREYQPVTSFGGDSFHVAAIRLGLQNRW
jgi:hypothetical protein